MRSTQGSSQHSSGSFPPESLPRAIADGASTPIETTSEFFSNGVSIALIADADTRQLRLLVSNGDNYTAAPSIKYQGRMYVPPDLDQSILEAVTIPTECVPYGSTDDLFHGIQRLLVDHGFPEEAALVATYFSVSSWFPDCLPAAPCLLITGPRAEACFFLQLLGCLVRHPFPLISGMSLRSLPMVLHPTLLIDDACISARDLRALISSTNANAYVPRKAGLVNLYGAKAIYVGEGLDDEISKDVVFHLNLPPSHGKLPILDANNQKSIAGHFQPRFLSYRLRNYAKVRASEFDLSQFDSGLRILARILGASVVDALDLQTGVGSLLQSQQESIRVARWVDLRCVVIEAALALCHRKDVDRMYVGELANNAERILKGRAQTVTLEPRAVGAILRTLALRPSRDAKGFAIRLTKDVRRKVHKLARDFDVGAAWDSVPLCEHCAELVVVGDTRRRDGST